MQKPGDGRNRHSGNDRSGRRGGPRRDHHRHAPMDKKVEETIAAIQSTLHDSLEPVLIPDLNGFQRKQIHRHFENSLEYRVKAYRELEDVVLKIYPVGQLKRLAEMKAQEVIMKGESEILPPMGAYERFVIHDYLKDRDGIKTESYGEGKDRHIEISPHFGRMPKKAKRRLTR